MCNLCVCVLPVCVRTDLMPGLTAGVEFPKVVGDLVVNLSSIHVEHVLKC